MDALQRAELMARLERDAALIAERFGLRYRVIEPEPPRVRRRYGVCYRDGTIRIRLFHVVTGKPLRYSSLVATLCHELAHLRHFDHSPRFRSFNQRVLAWAREAGIYRPDVERTRARSVPQRVTRERERRSEEPTQLALFG